MKLEPREWEMRSVFKSPRCVFEITIRKFLAAALAGFAPFLVSGGKDLLELDKAYRCGGKSRHAPQSSDFISGANWGNSRTLFWS